MRFPGGSVIPVKTGTDQHETIHGIEVFDRDGISLGRIGMRPSPEFANRDGGERGTESWGPGVPQTRRTELPDRQGCLASDTLFPPYHPSPSTTS